VEETLSHVAKTTTNAYLENGVLGATIVVLLVVSAVLFWQFMKQNELSSVINTMEENEKEFLAIYKKSQEHHKEVTSLITQALEIERNNTKECYKNLDSKIDQLLLEVRRKNV